MKLIGLVLLALVALGRANKDCSENRVTSCLDNLLEALLGSDSEEKVCKELQKVNNCLKSAADDCLGEDREAEVDEGLKELDDLLKERCPNVVSEDESDDDSCLAENTDYLMECMGQGATEAIRLLGLGPDLDENAMRCTIYSLISQCVLERTEEKCGKEVKDELQAELEDPPQEIKDACEAAGSVEVHDFELLEKKK